MARYSAGALTTAVPTAARAALSLFAAAAISGKLRELGFTNTAATSCANKLARLTAQGAGPGTALVEAKYDPDSKAADVTGFHSATVDHTVGDDLGYRAVLGAAVGAGVIWTFGDTGIRWPVGTANGVGLLLESGTGQNLQVYGVWDE